MKPKIPFDASNVRDVFNYDGGVLFWKDRPRSAFTSDRAWKNFNINIAGKRAGLKPSKAGYIYITITIQGRRYIVYAHRLVWAWHHGEWPKDQLDHIDHNRSNNDISNLRETTNATNHRNRTMQANNSSGVTGVYWDKEANKWLSAIRINQKLKKIGRFKCIGQAIKARKEAQVAAGFHENHGRYVPS